MYIILCPAAVAECVLTNWPWSVDTTPDQKNDHGRKVDELVPPTGRTELLCSRRSIRHRSHRNCSKSLSIKRADLGYLFSESLAEYTCALRLVEVV